MKACNLLINIVVALRAIYGANSGVLAEEIIEEVLNDSTELPVEEIHGHDSIDNKENVLNIQDDFPVYENFEVVTQEKTIYITKGTETITIYSTITVKGMMTTTILATTTTTETKTTTFIPEFIPTWIPTLIPIPIPTSFIESSYITTNLDTNTHNTVETSQINTSVEELPTPGLESKLSTTSLINTESTSKLQTVLTSSFVPTEIPDYAPTTTSVESDTTPSAITSMEEGAKPLTSYSTEEKTTLNVIEPSSRENELFTTKGELDMILGDRRKLDFENISEKSIYKPTRTFELENGGLSKDIISTTDTIRSDTIVDIPLVGSSSEFTIQTLTPTLSTDLLTTQFTSYPAASTLSPSTTFKNISSSMPYEEHTSNGNSTNKVFHNGTTQETGLEHLLKHFSPYTDLPAADYEITNGCNRNFIDTKALLAGLFVVLSPFV